MLVQELQENPHLDQGSSAAPRSWRWKPRGLLQRCVAYLARHAGVDSLGPALVQSTQREDPTTASLL
jgi:hypothetical protein